MFAQPSGRVDLLSRGDQRLQPDTRIMSQNIGDSFVSGGTKFRSNLLKSQAVFFEELCQPVFGEMPPPFIQAVVFVDPAPQGRDVSSLTKGYL